MKIIFQIAFTIVFAGVFASIFAQVAPAGAGDSSLRDDNIRMRSVELERIKQDADKEAMIRRDNGTELNFYVIKEDFEGIQKQESSIIEAYTKEKEINYKKINKAAGKITESAVRLKANLFPSFEFVADQNEEAKGTKSANAAGDGVKELIIALDGAIGTFVASQLFKDLTVVDVELSKKTLTHLEAIINLSGALWFESNKLKLK